MGGPARGPGLGASYTHEIGPGEAVFVPRGVANAFQVLEDATAYAYLVDDHRSPDATYVEVDAGEPRSWCGWARAVFEAAGRSAEDVTAVSTEEYAAGKDLAPRPAHSTLRLDKLRATGFEPADAEASLHAYVAQHPA